MYTSSWCRLLNNRQLRILLWRILSCNIIFIVVSSPLNYHIASLLLLRKTNTGFKTLFKWPTNSSIVEIKEVATNVWPAEETKKLMAISAEDGDVVLFLYRSRVSGQMILNDLQWVVYVGETGARINQTEWQLFGWRAKVGGWRREGTVQIFGYLCARIGQSLFRAIKW